MSRCIVQLPLIALIAMVGCRTDQPAPPPPDAEPAASADHFPTLPDSLVFTTPGGVEVWFANARTDTNAAGVPCVERGLAIVRDSVRRLVPLLMTGSAPVQVNDSTMHARLSLHCEPGDDYTVNLRTGLPVRIK